MKYFTIIQEDHPYIVLPKEWTLPNWIQNDLFDRSHIKNWDNNGILQTDTKYFLERVGDPYCIVNKSGIGKCGGKIYNGANKEEDIKDFLEKDFSQIFI